MSTIINFPRGSSSETPRATASAAGPAEALLSLQVELLEEELCAIRLRNRVAEDTRIWRAIRGLLFWGFLLFVMVQCSHAHALELGQKIKFGATPMAGCTNLDEAASISQLIYRKRYFDMEAAIDRLETCTVMNGPAFNNWKVVAKRPLADGSAWFCLEDVNAIDYRPVDQQNEPYAPICYWVRLGDKPVK
jgi:hypothetical protein